MRRSLLVTLATLLFHLPAASAAEPLPLWIKAKCALCHGKDGSGKTDTGKKLAVRDLRSPAVQKLTDKELTESIARGHKRMPAFQKQVTAGDVRILLDYIRDLAGTAKDLRK
jgi:mono/diheme cytochrome c family protein